MTIKEAYRVLGLSPGTGLREIKKKYHELMIQVHPDAGVQTRQQTVCSAHQSPVQNNYAYTAQEINAAYSVLKDKLSSDIPARPYQDRNRHPKREPATAWNAPVNPYARTEREILQYVEDYEGTVLGNFCIAKGKYMWTTDEDFSLFLLSMYRCSKQLLDDADALLCREAPPVNRPQFQAELAYLLAQQFTASTDLLQKLAREEKSDQDGCRIFYIPSMLESSNKNVVLRAGEALYPSKIRQHRLYLNRQTGQEAGYLSFPDDRLYYAVIPLFEQKGVQVRIQAAERRPEKKSAARYQNLHLWLKLSAGKANQLPENLNLQIEQLLEQYKSSL